MALTDDIKRCRTPQEAILMLAKAIDDMRYVARRIENPWEQPLNWFAPATELPPMMGLRAVVENTTGALHGISPNADAIAAVQTQLANETDPDERRALEARLRLLKEDGGTIAGVPDGKRVVEAEFTPGSLRPTQAISVGANTVDLPVPTLQQQLDRADWAEQRKLWDFIPLDEDETVKAFARGGPMWLYLGNRDAVMAMPVEWRRELVEMVAEDSIAQSQEVGADILKIADSPDRELYRGV